MNGSPLAKIAGDDSACQFLHSSEARGGRPPPRCAAACLFLSQIKSSSSDTSPIISMACCNILTSCFDRPRKTTPENCNIGRTHEWVGETKTCSSRVALFVDRSLDIKRLKRHAVTTAPRRASQLRKDEEVDSPPFKIWLSIRK